jgi:hypothetical protein
MKREGVPLFEIFLPDLVEKDIPLYEKTLLLEYVIEGVPLFEKLFLLGLKPEQIEEDTYVYVDDFGTLTHYQKPRDVYLPGGEYAAACDYRTSEDADNLECMRAEYATWLTLKSVMTVREIAEEYNLNPRGIRATIERGVIPARKSGGTWLVRRKDAEARWRKE